MSTVETKYKTVATVVHGNTYTVSSRYSLQDSKILGKGSFGVVATAYDAQLGISVAVKRVRPYANDDWDARHTLREIRLLRLLRNHPNIIGLSDLSINDEKAELYMMLECMDCDLHKVIQSKQTLTHKHFKCFTKQMLEGIKAMHSIGVFHRDLKPGNILVSRSCQLRITDFGLARFMDESTRSGNNSINPMTEYVVTRWYRPPELLLSAKRPYSEAIDMWSIGCIVAEMILRKPLFPGKSHAHQVQVIFDILGLGSIESLGFPVSGEAAVFLEKKCSKGVKQPLSKVIPEADADEIQLMEALLTINPTRRPTAVTCLDFPFVRDADAFYDYSCSYLTRPKREYFDFEQEHYSINELRDMIKGEVLAIAEDNNIHSSRFRKKSTGPEHDEIPVAMTSDPQAGYKGAQSHRGEHRTLDMSRGDCGKDCVDEHNCNGPSSQMRTMQKQKPLADKMQMPEKASGVCPLPRPTQNVIPYGQPSETQLGNVIASAKQMRTGQLHDSSPNPYVKKNLGNRRVALQPIPLNKYQSQNRPQTQVHKASALFVPGATDAPDRHDKHRQHENPYQNLHQSSHLSTRNIADLESGEMYKGNKEMPMNDNSRNLVGSLNHPNSHQNYDQGSNNNTVNSSDNLNNSNNQDVSASNAVGQGNMNSLGVQGNSIGNRGTSNIGQGLPSGNNLLKTAPPALGAIIGGKVRTTGLPKYISQSKSSSTLPAVGRVGNISDISSLLSHLQGKYESLSARDLNVPGEVGDSNQQKSSRKVATAPTGFPERGSVGTTGIGESDCGSYYNSAFNGFMNAVGGNNYDKTASAVAATAGGSRPTKVPANSAGSFRDYLKFPSLRR